MAKSISFSIVLPNRKDEFIQIGNKVKDKTKIGAHFIQCLSIGIKHKHFNKGGVK